MTFFVFSYDKISQLEDPDSDNAHTANGHSMNGLIGTGIVNGNGSGSGTERDKNHMEERKNSFLSQSQSIDNSPAHNIHRGAVDGIAMKSFSVQPSVTTPLNGKRNLSPSSRQQIKSYGSAK